MQNRLDICHPGINNLKHPFQAVNFWFIFLVVHGVLTFRIYMLCMARMHSVLTRSWHLAKLFCIDCLISSSQHCYGVYDTIIHIIQDEEKLRPKEVEWLTRSHWVFSRNCVLNQYVEVALVLWLLSQQKDKVSNRRKINIFRG